MAKKSDRQSAPLRWGGKVSIQFSGYDGGAGALVYIATPDRTKNINWLGEAPVEALAAQIAAAHGPSGPNNEYVFRLAAAMRQVRPPSMGLIGLI